LVFSGLEDAAEAVEESEQGASGVDKDGDTGMDGLGK
jgi:hypothetical protein